MSDPGRTRALGRGRVKDCMHHGILSCPADTALAEVAGMMARHSVHAVAITDRPGGRPVGIVTALDVIAALVDGAASTAREAAGTAPITASTEESLTHASQLMVEHGVSHLVVVDAASGYPVGVLSTIDVVAVYAGPGRE
jgi:CBS domain-containing protein